MKQHRTRSDSFGLRDKIGYMMGDFGCNMSFQLVSSYAMIYFTQGSGLNAWFLGCDRCAGENLRCDQRSDHRRVGGSTQTFEKWQI